MSPRFRSALRFFVSASLAGGGLSLLAGSVLLESLPASVVPAAVAVGWSAGLAGIALAARRSEWPWAVPAGAILVSMLGAIGWARFEPSGHLVLSGLTPFVALLTGGGILLRERWAWPVALASVAGFGPIVLVLAPLPDAFVAGAFALFGANVVALLLVHPDFSEPAKPGPGTG